jgi:hypothetical protein
MLIEVVAWSVLTSVHVSKALYVVTAYGYVEILSVWNASQSIYKGFYTGRLHAKVT